MVESRKYLLVMLFCSGLVSSACCPKRPELVLSSPENTVREFIAAVDRKDLPKALEYVDTKSKRLDEDGLKRLLNATDGGKPVALDSLEADSDLKVELRARIKSTQGKREIHLIKREHGWRIISNSLRQGRKEGPRATLDEFLEAIESGNCDALVRFAPPGVRAERSSKLMANGCAEQIEDLRILAKKIRAHENDLVIVSDTRAVLPYHEQMKLVLSKHGEHWFVDDL